MLTPVIGAMIARVAACFPVTIALWTLSETAELAEVMSLVTVIWPIAAMVWAFAKKLVSKTSDERRERFIGAPCGRGLTRLARANSKYLAVRYD